MNGEPVISLEDVTKVYRVWDNPTSRLKSPMLAGLANSIFWSTKYKEKVLSKAVSYYREFEALKDINFEIFKGESIGIVGRNGSGKSTLLQIIAGTLSCTAGSVCVKGKLSALLELGSGFNPEFTGRENVYLNATIMGFRKSEIDNMYDDIAAFADIGKFIDQPVKTYSSGMLVRLAFSVQAQINPDILIIDEALAVGDSLFQKRCMQRLDRLTDDGVTLLFVSHAVESVRTLTSRAILLDKGKIRSSGNSSDIILEYRKLLHFEEEKFLKKASLAKGLSKIENRTVEVRDSSIKGKTLKMSFGDKDAEIVSVETRDRMGESRGIFHPTDKLIISVRVKILKSLCHLNIGIRIRNKEGVKIYSWGTLNQDMVTLAGEDSKDVFWDRSFSQGDDLEILFEGQCSLGSNFYEVQAFVTEEGKPYYVDQRVVHWVEEAAFFEVRMNQREYFFGGTSDLKFRSTVSGENV